MYNPTPLQTFIKLWLRVRTKFKSFFQKWSPSIWGKWKKKNFLIGHRVKVRILKVRSEIGNKKLAKIRILQYLTYIFMGFLCICNLTRFLSAFYKSLLKTHKYKKQNVSLVFRKSFDPIKEDFRKTSCFFIYER